MIFIPDAIVAALLVFYVPSESGEKVTLGISALLSMTVFLMTIRESLPPTEKTPLISKRIIQIVTFAGLILASVTVNRSHELQQNRKARFSKARDYRV